MSTHPPYRDDVEASSSFLPPRDSNDDSSSRSSMDSTSTTSLILERINPDGGASKERADDVYSDDDDDSYDPETLRHTKAEKPMERKVRRIIYLIGALLVGSWVLALVIYLARESYRVVEKETPHDPAATKTAKAGQKIMLDDVLESRWRPGMQNVKWVEGEKDGLMLVTNGKQGFVEVHDVTDENYSQVLMKARDFSDGKQPRSAQTYWPCRDLKHLLLATEIQSVWRHSSTAHYWILDVETQNVEPLVPGDPEMRMSLAKWSPNSDAIAFVTGNNVYIRNLEDGSVVQVTEDGGTNLFYGIPDWVYEEEVFSGNSALWWSEDGGHLAFLRTNETEVPEYPLQYFASRPSGDQPAKGLENYPELDFIKYPKAGAPNPVVHLQFFDAEKKEVFTVDIEKDFPDDDRLITEVLWAGSDKVLIRGTNRESDLLRMMLVDVGSRTGKVVREVNITAIDGGWFEISQNTAYIPADPANGRPHDGYVDQIVFEGYDHLAYFSPLDSGKPISLTKGNWEVVDAPSAIDLKNNLVYFVSTEKSPVERHVYSVYLNGTGLQPLTDVTKDGAYSISFSKEAQYALLSYNGPGIPYQKMIGTPGLGKHFEKEWTTNPNLEKLASKYELPTFHYSTVKIDGFEFQVLERRPPHFNPKKKYPVLFYVYGGPGSQMVNKRFSIDFQAYVAANLEYIVVTVDGRGTGFIGRKARCAVRGNIGYWEAHDQIETAKIWKSKPYVDGSRIAIWGWSYGGFMTLKTLEQDGGQTFKYGMAVAPVTDWAYYDSIYTERYMHTPQHNPEGYLNASVHDVAAVGKNVRFLMMHGVADDNVHFQNTLTLLDRFDLAGIENYDVHVFPDSDHSIYFHNANKMVYDRLSTWLVRAFNGEYLKLVDLQPVDPKTVQGPKEAKLVKKA